jgi:hypothetical protein
MTRFLVWKDEEEEKGWACSSCNWRFPLPSLLQDEDARKAYDRLGAAKFKEHTCKDSLQSMSSNWQAEAPSSEHPFAARARALVKRGYKPKDAVGLVLDEMALECRNDPKAMAQAKAEGEKFLREIREGRI